MIKRLSAVAAAVLVSLGGVSAAQEGTGAPFPILRPDEVQEAYPAAAKAKGLEGEATITCDGNAKWLSNCRVMSEAPAGEGFGDAALAIARRYQVERAEPRSGILQTQTFKIVFAPPQTRSVRAGGVEYILPLQTERPSLDALYAAWPRAERFTGTEGQADLWCTAALDGRLKDCTIRKEYLGDKGFGAAALSMAPLFRYQPALRDGKPVAMSIPVKVEFACDSRCRAFRGASVREDRRWLAVPTPDQVLAAYPPVARGRGVEGQVRLDCGVGKAGGLEACETIAESVEGEGFAAAALGLTSLFRLEAPEPKASPVRIGLVVAFGPSPAIPAWFQGRRYVPLLDAAGAPVTGEARLKCRVAPSGMDACQVLDPDKVDPIVRQEVLKRAAALSPQLWTKEGRSTIGYAVEMRFTLDPSRNADLLGGEPRLPIVAPGVVDYRPRTQISAPRHIASFYPDRAMRMEVNGRVAVECPTLVEGKPDGCKIVSEAPLDYGFGDAALKVSEQFRFVDETIDGASTHEPVRLPINFSVPL
jgi:TonB family protein